MLCKLASIDEIIIASLLHPPTQHISSGRICAVFQLTDICLCKLVVAAARTKSGRLKIIFESRAAKSALVLSNSEEETVKMRRRVLV